MWRSTIIARASGFLHDPHSLPDVFQAGTLSPGVFLAVEQGKLKREEAVGPFYSPGLRRDEDERESPL